VACETIRTFLTFFSKSKKHDFLRLFELLHTFSRTLHGHMATRNGQNSNEAVAGTNSEAFAAPHYMPSLNCHQWGHIVSLCDTLFIYAFVYVAVHSVGVEEERELQTFDSVPNVSITSYCSVCWFTLISVA